MQCTVDFDFLGSSANELSHLVNRHDKAQLNFELNLRGYRNKLPFRAEAPWQYPAAKNFSPEHTLKDIAERGKFSNHGIFRDKFNESNVSAILHTLEPSTSVYGNQEWFADLRGDRKLHRTKPKPIVRSPKKVVSPKTSMLSALS